MATLTEVSRPYEFLARWDTKTGRLAGAHVGFSTVLLRDGVFANETPEPVQPVGAMGFPLGDILSVLQVDALKELAAAKEALQVEQQSRLAEVASKNAQIAALTAQLAGK